MIATVALLAVAGLFVGCKQQEPVPQAPGPQTPVVKTPVDKTAGDEVLTTSPPPIIVTTPSPTPKPIGASPTPAPAGARTYVVKRGDTLFSIARTELGGDTRVKDILAANPGLDRNAVLKVGQEIQLPAK